MVLGWVLLLFGGPASVPVSRPPLTKLNPNVQLQLLRKVQALHLRKDRLPLLKSDLQRLFFGISRHPLASATPFLATDKVWLSRTPHALTSNTLTLLGVPDLRLTVGVGVFARVPARLSFHLSVENKG